MGRNQGTIRHHKVQWIVNINSIFSNPSWLISLCLAEGLGLSQSQKNDERFWIQR